MRNSVQFYANEFENIDKNGQLSRRVKICWKVFLLIMILWHGRLFLNNTQNSEFIKFRETALTSYKFKNGDDMPHKHGFKKLTEKRYP